TNVKSISFTLLLHLISASKTLSQQTLLNLAQELQPSSFPERRHYCRLTASICRRCPSKVSSAVVSWILSPSSSLGLPGFVGVAASVIIGNAVFVVITPSSLLHHQ
ncbi:hypothetical protein HN873_021577, partial [Arachis hypogaea]